MTKIKVGDSLNINFKDYKVIGYIVYQNPDDDNKYWTEYRTLDKHGKEFWVTFDDFYNEYSISWPVTVKNGMVSSKWHKVDEGRQIVIEAVGDVDVDVNEEASFVEHEDQFEEEILSVELWEDGAEFSQGMYLDEEEIVKSDMSFWARKDVFKAICIIVGVIIFGFYYFSSLPPSNMRQYMKDSPRYSYVTSITGNHKQKAYVFQANVSSYSPEIQAMNELESALRSVGELTVDSSDFNDDVVVDYVVKDLLINSNEQPECVTENRGEDGVSVAVVTANEYCLIYHPEGEPNVVYAQISHRKYNYTTDTLPYRSSSGTGRWYRSHYYSTGFQTDFGRWSKTPSSYTMYKGPVVKDFGNGYYDVYSRDIKRSSIMRRRSDSGGTSWGK